MKRAILVILSSLFCASLLAVAAYGQGGPPPPGPGGPHGFGGFGPGGGGLARGLQPWKVVTGAPFSADVSDQHVQTLSDGNTIQHTVTGHIARDAQGRTYLQHTITGGPLAANGPTTITFISDPVAGYSYVLNPTTKIAMRRALKAPGQGPGPNGTRPNHEPPPGSSANRIESDLGTQNINGVTAQGKSVTRTVPAGEMGNAKPIISTSETWYSPDLQVPVLAKHSDPRSGQDTYSLSNIQRGDPPASLFQVPSDYTVQDAPAHGPEHPPVP